MTICKMLLFSKLYLVSISFSVSIKNHLCFPNKEKTYKLFVYGCNIFLVNEQNEHINTKK